MMKQTETKAAQIARPVENQPGCQTWPQDHTIGSTSCSLPQFLSMKVHLLPVPPCHAPTSCQHMLVSLQLQPLTSAQDCSPWQDFAKQRI